MKRGQIGNIMATFPVMILVFLVILIFLSLTALFIGNKVSYPVAASAIEDNLLLREVNIKDKQGYIREMSLFDSIAEDSRDDGKVDLYQNYNSQNAGIFDNLIKDDKTCLILYVYREGNLNHFITSRKTESGIWEGFSIDKYEKKNLLQELSVKIENNNLDIKYYLGECADE